MPIFLNFFNKSYLVHLQVLKSATGSAALLRPERERERRSFRLRRSASASAALFFERERERERRSKNLGALNALYFDIFLFSVSVIDFKCTTGQMFHFLTKNCLILR